MIEDSTKSYIMHLSSSIDSSSFSDIAWSFGTSIPHSRMTFRYFPARRILCFQLSKRGGTHAPPGRWPPADRGGGMPAWCRLDDPGDIDPSRSYGNLMRPISRRVTKEHNRRYIFFPNTRPHNPYPKSPDRWIYSPSLVAPRKDPEVYP